MAILRRIMTAPTMTAAAREFLDVLDPEQRTKAALPFEDHGERSTWFYFPNHQSGLPLGEMTRHQQKRAHRLLLSGMSFHAYARANQVIALESVLDVLEDFGLESWRDSNLYHVSVFGTPGSEAWGWRFNGHHVCVNYTLRGDEVIAATPMFLGANRARLQHEGRDYSRPFGDAEDLGRELLWSLPPLLKAKAIISERAPADFVLANSPHPESARLTNERFYLPKGGTFPGLLREVGAKEQDLRNRLGYNPEIPAGVPADELSPGQRDLLARLAEHYASRYPDGVAWTGMTDLDGLHFAWAGGVDQGEPHYYRLQGPELLVEYDNVQDGANHVHTVCRHPRNDFGADALGLHYAEWHRPQ